MPQEVSIDMEPPKEKKTPIPTKAYGVNLVSSFVFWLFYLCQNSTPITEEMLGVEKEKKKKKKKKRDRSEEKPKLDKPESSEDDRDKLEGTGW